MSIISDERAQELLEIEADADRMRAALLAIKGLVVGDKVPRWAGDWATTHTRGQIADMVDTAVHSAPTRSLAKVTKVC